MISLLVQKIGILKNMSKHKNNDDNQYNNRITKDKLVAVSRSIHFGPLPSAEQLKQYKDISIDLPDRIITMAEKEQCTRLENNKNIIKHTYGMQCLGLILGFILSSMTIIFGLILIIKGKEVFGIFISLLGFSGIIRTFINSPKK